MGGLLTFIRPSHRENGEKNRDSGESIGSGSESTQSADDVPFAHGVLEEIARYVNLAELKHTFVEEGLLEDEDLAVDLGAPFREFSKQKDRLTYLKRIFVDKRKFEQFRRCIKKIFQKPGGHLGHNYIYTLLYSTKSKFAQESSIRMSQILHERIERNVYTLIRCIKPSLLYQQMFQKRLLTEAEFERFSNSNLTDIESNERVFALLKTKGPTAHLLFTQCLSETDESYECHREVITLLNRSYADECISPEQPLTLIQVPSYLKGKDYHERRKRFEACYHNGNWAALEEESKKCTDSNIPEIMAIGYLELALGWIFQLNEPEVKKNLKLAHHVITTMVKNPAILYARHEYLHALLLRYLKQYPEASKKAESAMMILTLFDVGEDKAFAQYCFATSFVETLTPWCSDEEFCKAQTMLVTAIDYSRKAVDMEILYSHVLTASTHSPTFGHD